MPVKIGFFLNKNIAIILSAAEEIEQNRINIITLFGSEDESSNYKIKLENIETAQQELDDLANIEQDLNIHMFKLSEFDGIELTYEQLSAIAFMIEED